ncbi:WD-40 repeat protein [Reticulomyxa filosa]|uniref:WD-40 repeat protein n=1 Tax=Reticulomyxa filosa TaxID=46433 RepID=X6LGL0_RETFI|nr:WD-40 repeat protein [Reticulomyxa filosa]|eukprot:ETO00724.1 WD-40 repeat protein [Reticulomyxa filosa]
MLDTFLSSSKLLNTFIGHTNKVWSIDYSTFDDCQFIYSGSSDNTVRVWDIENNKQIQSFHGHADAVGCVKFSPYHYHDNRRHVICSSSDDTTSVRIVKYGSDELVNTILSGSWDQSVRMWDIRSDRQIQAFDGHTGLVNVVEYSPFVVDNIEIGGLNYIYSMDIRKKIME